jgi:REP element-mobilizing transposase RayT
MSTPIAYLLTWTTYGTWLHGDERGSVDRKAKRPFRNFVPPNPRFEALRVEQLKFPPLLIAPKMRRVIREAIEQDCEFRQRKLFAVNVRTNHVHVVIAHAAAPDKMLHALKSRCTRMLRKSKLLDPAQPVWTSGGSKTWLLNEEERADAIHYVLHEQGEALPET